MTICIPNVRRTYVAGRFVSAAQLNRPDDEKQNQQSPRLYKKGVHKKSVYVDIKSLEKYRNMYGHLQVPVRFGFREEEREGLGIFAGTLGSHVASLRKAYMKLNDSDKEKQAWVSQLQSIGFVWAPLEEAFHLHVRAILHYQKLYGDFLIPRSFVVPVELECWPEDYHGLKLGRIYEYIRRGTLPAHRREILKENGIPQADFMTQKAESILQAIEVYKKVHQQTAETLDIKRSFHVPVCDEEWPEHLWGLNLGDAVYNIKTMHCFDKYLTQFEEAGVKPMPHEYVEVCRAQLKMRNQAKKEGRAKTRSDARGYIL